LFYFDRMLLACYSHAMKNLQVKNIPDSLHKKLWHYAKKNHSTLSDFVLSALNRELDRLEWEERISKRPDTNLKVSAASLLKEERSERYGELD